MVSPTSSAACSRPRKTLPTGGLGAIKKLIGGESSKIIKTLTALGPKLKPLLKGAMDKLTALTK